MFEKGSTLFPVKEHCCFLAHCAVSPLYVGAASAAQGFHGSMVEKGIAALPDFVDLLPRFRASFAGLMKTATQNVSFMHSTAESMCQIANAYPFEPGDQIISYVHEYPSNHYPWAIQRRRGAELVLLPDVPRAEGFAAEGRPSGWSMADLERLCTARTRVVALSHVQFASGYAADLTELGIFCRDRGIDLIIDCAQSLGCLPFRPEEHAVAAAASSGWKWLLGPKGAAVLYTSPELRAKLVPTMAGPGMMKQQFDYLDHSWNPFVDGRMFEYSTLPWDHVAALAIIAEDIFSRYRIEDISAEVFRLQDLFLDKLDPRGCRVQRFADKHRSGILSVVPVRDPVEVMKRLAERGIIVTERAGYLRLAPHFYLEDEQVEQAAAACNDLFV